MTTSPMDAMASPEELLDTARGNATGFILGMLDYARELGQTPESAALWIGRRFAPGWDELGDRDARGVAEVIARNIASCGGQIASVTGDDDHAVVVIAGWPDAETLAFFGTDQATADAIYTAFAPITERIGHRCAWRRDDDEVTLTVDRAS